MGPKRTYQPGQKWHVSADGQVRPCNADKMACRLRHFDTSDEARDTRQHQATSIQADDLVSFAASIGERPSYEPESVEQPLNVNDLRSAAHKAYQKFIATGKRPRSPLGEISVYLPGDQHVTLKRETYDLPHNPSKVGTRYRMRYFSTPTAYEQDFVELNSRLDYDLLAKRLDDYFVQAAESNSSEEDLTPYYDKTLTALGEVEVMARGAEKAYTGLGLDLFSHENPGTLNISLNYEQSALESHDIAESLRGHAHMDDTAQLVEVEVSGNLDSEGNSWSLNRLGDGSWYLGVNSTKGMMAQGADTPEEMSRLLGKVMKAHNTQEQKQRETIGYLTKLMTDVDNSVQSYEYTIAARQQHVQEKMEERRAKEQYENFKEQASYGGSPAAPSLAEKLGNLFS